MGKISEALSPFHKDFILKQKMFFVATAPKGGLINLSPKGLDSFRILDDTSVLWLNLTGSGNETAAHLLEDSRMTIMMNAFEGPPMILRLYGQARSIHPRDDEWLQYITMFEPSLAARQLILLKVEKVMTSCGFGVPLMEYQGDREQLPKWADKKGEEGVQAYWREKNTVSLDGKPTGLFSD
ncbi:MAG: pyridoxamine 5'-phosphate oxidase family protein [Bacteroidia bacterium]|nr:pyridoxamine 5'-phosphate oxidase family protein [Bacteroidia bacterium]